MYKEIEGDLIELALKGEFDVIVHGCNCFCTMQAGIAPLMAKTFGCDKFEMEQSKYRSDINKLGTINYININWNNEVYSILHANNHYKVNNIKDLIVVNAYTQYGFGRNHSNGTNIPLDYEALTLCMRKINHSFKGQHIGLPQIGCGLAGGDWDRVKSIIQNELKECDVTIVIFKK